MSISISELESQIFDKEEVRVIIRANKDQTVERYPYSRKASVTTSVTDLIENRIKPLVGNAEVVVVNGEGLHPHGRTKVETVRNSYV